MKILTNYLLFLHNVFLLFVFPLLQVSVVFLWYHLIIKISSKLFLADIVDHKSRQKMVKCQLFKSIENDWHEVFLHSHVWALCISRNHCCIFLRVLVFLFDCVNKCVIVLVWVTIVLANFSSCFLISKTCTLVENYNYVYYFFFLSYVREMVYKTNCYCDFMYIHVIIYCNLSCLCSGVERLHYTVYMIVYTRKLSAYETVWTNFNRL